MNFTSALKEKALNLAPEMSILKNSPIRRKTLCKFASIFLSQIAVNYFVKGETWALRDLINIISRKYEGMKRTAYPMGGSTKCRSQRSQSRGCTCVRGWGCNAKLLHHPWMLALSSISFGHKITCLSHLKMSPNLSLNLIYASFYTKIHKSSFIYYFQEPTSSSEIEIDGP